MGVVYPLFVVYSFIAGLILRMMLDIAEESPGNNKVWSSD